MPKIRTLWPGVLISAASSLQAQPAAEVFRDADLSLGNRLVNENNCVACHASKVGGDGSAIYKPQGSFRGYWCFGSGGLISSEPGSDLVASVAKLCQPIESRASPCSAIR